MESLAKQTTLSVKEPCRRYMIQRDFVDYQEPLAAGWQRQISSHHTMLMRTCQYMQHIFCLDLYCFSTNLCIQMLLKAQAQLHCFFPQVPWEVKPKTTQPELKIAQLRGQTSRFFQHLHELSMEFQVKSSLFYAFCWGSNPKKTAICNPPTESPSVLTEPNEHKSHPKKHNKYRMKPWPF